MITTLSTFTRIALRDVVAGTRPPGEPLRHCQAAVEWLKRAHDKSPDDGVSYGYSVKGGWRPSYRETSGYIAVTFYNLAKAWNDPELRERAERVVRWLLTVQNQDGSFSNPKYSGDHGIVFDTGQVLFGLVRAAEETGDQDILSGAERAAQWLVETADEEGRWTRNVHLGIPHVYNTRVAWALLRWNTLRPSSAAETVARANLDWALTQQRSGWFEQCAFKPDVAPFTHTIAYAIRGLLEAGQLLGEARYTDAAILSAETVLPHVRGDGFIPGQIDTDGKARAKYCCLTGNCQLAIIWAKLYELGGDERFRDAAVRALRWVMACQDIETSNLDVRGAIKGSQPIWGRYSRMTYPNWPTKFFIDAMLLCLKWL